MLGEVSTLVDDQFGDQFNDILNGDSAVDLQDAAAASGTTTTDPLDFFSNGSNPFLDNIFNAGSDCDV